MMDEARNLPLPANDGEEGPGMAYVVSGMKQRQRLAWRITQDGIRVASGFTPDAMTGYQELSRYVMQYADEGPLAAEVRIGDGRWEKVDMAISGPTQ